MKIALASFTVTVPLANILVLSLNVISVKKTFKSKRASDVHGKVYQTRIYKCIKCSKEYFTKVDCMQHECSASPSLRPVHERF